MSMNMDLDAGEAAAARDIEERRYDGAFRKYSVLAEHGSGTAQLRLGWMYKTGTGVLPDVKMAERWYLRAATTESAQAQYYLASLYRDTEQHRSQLSGSREPQLKGTRRRFTRWERPTTLVPVCREIATKHSSISRKPRDGGICARQPTSPAK